MMLKTKRLTHQIPLALTALRALLAPVVVALALFFPNKSALVACVVIAFLSDVFDGIIARRLGIATANLRRLDSIADSIFYIAALFAAWHLYPAVIQQYKFALLFLAIIEIVRYVFDYIKFKREASYHMWSSKLWGICLFAGFIALFGFGDYGIAVALAIYVGIIADIEGLIISMILREWKADVLLNCM